MRIRITPIIIIIAILAMSAGQAGAVNKLEGYYEMEASIQKTDQHWKFGPPGGEGMPKHYVEFKYLSWPYTNLESFFKLRATSNRDDNLTPESEFKNPAFIGAEGHLKLNGENWESFLFYRQNRFWIHDDLILNLVDQNKLKNDNWGPQSSGIRLDFWDRDLWKIHGLGGTVIYSDDGGTFSWNANENFPDGTDSFILRLRKNSFNERLRVGTMYLRKDWTNTGIKLEDERQHYLNSSYNHVLSWDLSLYPRNLMRNGTRLGPLNIDNSSWIIQYAVSHDPYQIETDDTRSDRDKDAFSIEVRNIRISDLTMHAWYNDFGINFRDYMSYRFDEGNEYNRRQYHIEGFYLFPKKAITATISYDYYERKEIVKGEETGNLRPTYNFYSELYVEFIKGFKGKIGYNRWHGFDGSAEVFDFFTYPNIFAELSVENKLAKVRMQGRIRDFNTFREVYAYGFDMEFNATGRLKGYFRLLNVNEKTEARATVFAQIRYDIGYGAECFLEYGAPWDSDHLVNTDGFVNEGSGTRLNNMTKLFLKLYF